MSERIGILTAGGDCPGLNAVIRAATVRGVELGREMVGIRNGWEGLLENEVVPLDRKAVSGILPLGGTMLGTSRMDPYVHGSGYESIAATVEANGLGSVIVVGGDGTLRTASRLAADGLPVVGVPKTIDNDIGGTDVTFGFHTAVQIATDAIDRLTTTAESHQRIIVVEVMGRTAGWIAAAAGMAGGADYILVPEVAYELDEVAAVLRRRHDRGVRYSIVVVAEGIEPPAGMTQEELPKDAFGFERLGGVGGVISRGLERATGIECRLTILGHVQRGGSPTAYDRILATRLGHAAADLAVSGASDVMVALRGTEIVPVDLATACTHPRLLDRKIYDVAATFFG